MLKIKTIHDYEYLPFVNKDLIFRGQSNIEHKLLPGTYRDKDDVKNIGPKFEILCVQNFIHHLWEKGYHTFPEDLLENNIFSTSSCIFPTKDILPYLAVAQHYACDSEFYWLKTSLLDVTFDIDVATYFAINKDYKEDGKLFVIDKNKIIDPYKIFEPHLDKRKEARMIVQKGAFIYREQKYESEGEMWSYNNTEPFDGFIIEEIIIPSFLKEHLKEYLQKKLFEQFLLPRLALGPMTVYMPSTGKRNEEELRVIYKNEIDRAKKAGKNHGNY